MNLQDAFTKLITKAEINAVEIVVVPEDWFEEIVSYPGASGQGDGAQVGCIFCQDLESCRRDVGESGNGQSSVGAEKGFENLVQFVVGPGQ